MKSLRTHDTCRFCANRHKSMLRDNVPCFRCHGYRYFEQDTTKQAYLVKQMPRRAST